MDTAASLISQNIITNNAISGTSGNPSALDCGSGSHMFVNNIVAFNTGGDFLGFTPEPTWHNTYSDPFFQDSASADWALRNYHLTASSTAVKDNADDGAASMPIMDIDGQQRKNGVVDRGADEYWP